MAIQGCIAVAGSMMRGQDTDYQRTSGEKQRRGRGARGHGIQTGDGAGRLRAAMPPPPHVSAAMPPSLM